ncbi:DNA polymerase II subunit C [Saitozyma sp. JCM 24511]|nr:DNA polymerase II subunit C [Saitozyma sp. JCM 24511]
MAPATSTSLSSKRPLKPSRFPVARIKKIMQLDEEVGKLASATPVMVSKSLECFLQLLVEETAKEARSRGSKKLTAYHLKATINATPSFDFLRDIVSTIPDPTVAEPRAGPSTSTATRGPRKPSDPFGGDGGVPATKKPRGRKPKKETEMEGNGYDEAGMPYPGQAVEQTAQGSLPMLGTWRRDMEGGGGTGPGGRGMYDDYEDDDDDY